MTFYTPEEIEFLKNNYPLRGSFYCANHLNRDKRSIIAKCIKLGIKFDIINYYDNINRKVDHKQFINIEDKYVAYILGFIWADGYIGKKEIQICISSNDLNNLKEIFLKTGEWRIYSNIIEDKKRNKSYNSSRIITKNQLLSKFLIDNDYKNKSHDNCNKILDKIPINLKSHFFRGFFDGDGCFNYNKKSRSYSCFLTGTYDQNWSSVENIYKHLDIKYHITKKSKEKSKYSTITISNKNDIDIFANYIYNEWDNIGLKRKFDYYHSFSNNKVKRHLEKKWSEKEIDYLMKNYNSKNAKEISIELNRKKSSILAKYYKQNKIKKHENFIRYSTD